MNALMMVFFFLLLITFSTATLFDHMFATTRIRKSYEDYLSVMHNLRDNVEETSYRAHIKLSKPKSPKSDKETPRGDYVSPRRKIKDSGKLNIAPLLSQNDPFLFNTLVNLFDDLYADTALFQSIKQGDKKLSVELAEAFITAARDVPQTKLNLVKVTLDDPKLAGLFYQMLKGSYYFDPDKIEGWPPLTDFLIIDGDKKRSALCTRSASPLLLKSFFGEDIAKQILEKEKQKHSDGAKISLLTKGEFEALISASQFQAHKRHIQYHNPKAKETTVLSKSDPDTLITARLLAPEALQTPDEEQAGEKDGTLSPSQTQMSPKFSPHASR